MHQRSSPEMQQGITAEIVQSCAGHSTADAGERKILGRVQTNSRPGSKKFDFDQSLDSEKKSRPWRRRAAIFRKLRSACVEVGTIDKYSACVEVGTIDKYSACVEVGTIIDETPAKRCPNINYKNY
ncbi:hypothetical protein TNCV_2498181 [Trichonephila clavipes]|nr:hypothetical protein TNCV_2498181 [Trichonephila clavipes]